MKTNITLKISIGYLVVLTMLVVAAVSIYQVFNTVGDKTRILVDQTLPDMRYAEQINNEVSGIELTAFQLYGYTTTAEAFQETIAAHNQQLETIISAFSNVDTATLDSLREVLLLVDERVGWLHSNMTAKKINWDRARNNLSAISEQTTAAKLIVTDIKAALDQGSMRSVQEVTGSLDQSTKLLSGVAGAVFLSVLLALWMTRRMVVRPLVGLAQDIDHVADNFDLHHEVKVYANDEIGNAASRFNLLLEVFRNALGDVQQAASDTRQAADSLNSVVGNGDSEIDQLTQQIDSLVDDTQALVTQIDDQVSRSEAAAGQATLGAEEIDQSSQQMQLTSRNIDRLAEDVELATEGLNRLHETSHQVGDVVKTIADIAGQTNLLALNAAIEAARAGEQGRGFAVVADEVRTLASHSHKSTAEINTMLETLVSEINQVVEQMTKGREQASLAVASGEKMAQALAQTKDVILDLRDQCQQAAAEVQQAGGQVKDIADGVQHFCSTGQRIADNSQSVQAEAHQLNSSGTRLSNVLSSTLSQFKV